MTHARIWTFRPPPGREQEFEKAYSASGAWARLFARSAEFRGTSLLKPAENGGCWLTIDRWASKQGFEAFKRAFDAEYRALDGQLEGVAGEEVFIGAFEEEG